MWGCKVGADVAGGMQNGIHMVKAKEHPDQTEEGQNVTGSDKNMGRRRRRREEDA